jgi:hypothetical protein
MTRWRRLEISRCLRLVGTMKITVAIFALLTLAIGTGVAMVASVHKEPVLLACGGPNC